MNSNLTLLLGNRYVTFEGNGVDLVETFANDGLIDGKILAGSYGDTGGGAAEMTG